MKKLYAVITGRRIQFFIRPNQTKIKKYREPISVWVLNCKTKDEALARKYMWESGATKAALHSSL
jgi:hypothetical protein